MNTREVLSSHSTKANLPHEESETQSLVQGARRSRRPNTYRLYWPDATRPPSCSPVGDPRLKCQSGISHPHQRQAIVIRLRSVRTAYHCLPSLLRCPPRSLCCWNCLI